MQAFAADGTKPTRAYGLNDDFSPTLQQLMIHFSGTAQQSSERIANIQGELDEARHVMVNNIESVLERGEKIELLVDKTESLNHQAFRFAKGARSLRREMWLQNLKMVLCVLFVVGLAVIHQHDGLRRRLLPSAATTHRRRRRTRSCRRRAHYCRRHRRACATLAVIAAVSGSRSHIHVPRGETRATRR